MYTYVYTAIRSSVPLATIQAAASCCQIYWPPLVSFSLCFFLSFQFLVVRKRSIPTSPSPPDSSLACEHPFVLARSLHDGFLSVGAAAGCLGLVGQSVGMHSVVLHFTLVAGGFVQDVCGFGGCRKSEISYSQLVETCIASVIGSLCVLRHPVTNRFLEIFTA